ncbi:helix-turn-helix domain-containing protein [Humitalea sp. 24SJ18S-53]|uniref:helix-turn-helix domain-containing protein n=1 Tax=Humitalea sp. 24SJ18S-53 TaxID=3422307 RepID=UPI003D67A3CE
MSSTINGNFDAIIPAQLRAARGLLGWSQDQLAAASAVPKRTVARFELGEGAPQQRTIAAIRGALEAAGVEFIKENGGGPGVRLLKAGAVPAEAASTPAAPSAADLEKRRVRPEDEARSGPEVKEKPLRQIDD